MLTGCLTLGGASSLVQDLEVSSECRTSALQLRGGGSWVENAVISSRIDGDGSTQLRSGIDVSAEHISIDNVEVKGFEAGVRVRKNAASTSIAHSRLIDNNVMNVNDDAYDNDYGAYGVLLEGRGAEVSWITISGSRAPSHDYGYDGSAVEIYDSSDNFIHHNVMVGNDAGSELGVGVDADNQPGATNNNTLGMNLIVSQFGAERNGACVAAGTCSNPAGIVLRGAEPGAHGPTTNTFVEHNTIHLPGAQTAALSCTGGCGNDVLSAVNNILSGTTAFVVTGSAFEQANLLDGRVYRPSGADDTGSIRRAPQFRSPDAVRATRDGYVLQPGSPGEHTYVDADGVARHGVRLFTYSSRGDLVGREYPADDAQINLGALQ